MKIFEELPKQKLLAISYMTYLMLCSVGIFLDSIFPIKAHIIYGNTIGIICFIVAPLLMIWAQFSVEKFYAALRKKEEASSYLGPYPYMRNPTQIALIILVAGYTAISNSIALCITSLISYYISNYFYLKHEFRLEKDYGTEYIKYKKSVKKYF